MLSTDPAAQKAFLKKVADTYGNNAARRIAETFDKWLVQFEASISGGVGRSLPSQEQEQERR
jgi:hypothetical protein